MHPPCIPPASPLHLPRISPASPQVHLLGDAAHQFPPAGAFGANTGLQDAHNLAWKLALTHHGAASEGLSRSYDAERRPVALANARLSVHNYWRGLRVAQALGLPTELPHAVAAAAQAARDALPPAAATPAAVLANAAGGAALSLLRRGLIDGMGHGAAHALGRWRLGAARRVVEVRRDPGCRLAEARLTTAGTPPHRKGAHSRYSSRGTSSATVTARPRNRPRPRPGARARVAARRPRVGLESRLESAARAGRSLTLRTRPTYVGIAVDLVSWRG